MIPNHVAHALSELDMTMVKSIPPGGNWKDIPETIPSKRLERIRRSYAAGEGSRSTYYGRLKPDAPAYTINTYFSRPGNGCHIHYDYVGGQHRTLSHREAARLQSFPDSFVFQGSKTAICQQIGNAVPPLLAYEIAQHLPKKGFFVDLFSGAGGLSLGFLWAGWEPIIGNDIEPAFFETYKLNVHDKVVLGDIRDNKVFEEIVELTKMAHKSNPNVPLYILGGPPCQGFSTAGKRRTMKDNRNWLFQQYKDILLALRPTGFVFENVTGLLNMQAGAVFDMIKSELEEVVGQVIFWILKAEEYGIPQRRSRVILIGDSDKKVEARQPDPKTQMPKNHKGLFPSLSPAITVADAISDLPPLKPGEDGSSKDYLFEPRNAYQALMRSAISPKEYFRQIACNESSCIASK